MSKTKSLKECREILDHYTTGPVVLVAAKDALAHAEKLLYLLKEAVTENSLSGWREAIDAIGQAEGKS